MRIHLIVSTVPLALFAFAATAEPIIFASDGNRFQGFTAPTDGIYEIVAFGAQGGSSFGHGGGLGAEIGGDFVLTAGETLRIAVGAMGGSSAVGGGGGGSFVVDPGSMPLVIAGGGGGQSP